MSTKFLFNHDFDHMPQKMRTYDQDELDIACREKYIEGHDAGYRQALLSIEENCRALLPKIHSELADHHSMMAHSALNASLIAANVIEALFPAFYHEAVLTQVRACIDDAVQHVLDKTNVHVRCALDVAEKLKNYGAEQKKHQSIPLVIEGDDSLHGSDVIMTWSGGMMERNEHSIKETIDHILKDYHDRIQHSLTNEGIQS